MNRLRYVRDCVDLVRSDSRQDTLMAAGLALVVAVPFLLSVRGYHQRIQGPDE